MRKSMPIVAALFATAVLFGPVPGAGASGAGLWGREYLGTAVEGKGRVPIARPRDVEVSFSRGHGSQWIGWEANCNGYGAKVRIGEGRLRLRELVGSAVFCPGRPNREDYWLLVLFESEPRWRLSGKNLKIWSGGRTLRLREKAD